MKKRQVRRLLDGLLKSGQEEADRLDSGKLLELWIAWLNLTIKDIQLEGLPPLVLMREFKKDRKLIREVKRIVENYDGEIIS